MNVATHRPAPFGKLGQAEFLQRAVAALWAWLGRDRPTGEDEVAKTRDGRARPGAEDVVELDAHPAPGLAVEDLPDRDGHAEHFLEAQRLSAELHAVGVVRLRAASLVLD